METFGGIDILCNNAGILNESTWEKMVSINLVSKGKKKFNPCVLVTLTAICRCGDFLGVVGKYMRVVQEGSSDVCSQEVIL